MTTQPPARVWLDVPYADKDAAKAACARWDPAAKRWFDPRPEAAGRPRPRLARWAAQPDVPELLPGEDRGFGSGLFVDMVPRSCWFTNVRSCIAQKDWERLRRMITRRAGQRCEICTRLEDRETRRWLEAHERWDYDDATGVQKLRRIVCLCSDGHLVTHMGYANVTGRSGEAIAHLREVTGMSVVEADRHIDAAGQLWTRRSGRTWALDLSMLTDAGITLAPPDAPAGRAGDAERGLRDARRDEPPPRSSAPAPTPPPRYSSPPVVPVPSGSKPIRVPYRSERHRRSWLDQLLSREQAGAAAITMATSSPWFAAISATTDRSDCT